jgi:hypothetical protein
MGREKKDLKEVWNILFPLQKGVRVELVEDTNFYPFNLTKENKTRLRKGSKGTVVGYREGSPFISVKFDGRNKIYLLEKKRVRRISNG